jgi:poly(A) polymerase/tRNA nucleotidyltransferase (CCA-adding enzyme)
MADTVARAPQRPLFWPDVVYSLQEMLLDNRQPVYIVGGAVRDALLHRPLTDIDLAVTEHGISLARRIANDLRGDFFVLDRERDVGRALLNLPEGRFVIDVARLRGPDLASDLLDRDFTVNAMAAELTGQLDWLIDPLGGEQDAINKILRRCTARSLQDDPIRALRAVRQSVQFGMRIEPATLNDVRAAGPLLAQVSGERLRDEFVKLLALPRVRAALRVADSLGLLAVILPEAARWRDLPANSTDYADGWQQTLGITEKLSQVLAAIDSRRTEDTVATFGIGMLVMQLDRYRKSLQQHIETPWPNDRPHAALLVLAGLLCDVAKPEEVAERAQALRLSNTERDRLLAVTAHYRKPLEILDWSPLQIHRFWRQAGAAGVDACLLAAANYLGRAASELDQDDWLAVIERLLLLLDAYFVRYTELVDPPVLLDGNQLMAQLQLQPGRLIGTLLEHIREAQVMGTVQTPEDALQWVRNWLAEQ